MIYVIKFQNLSLIIYCATKSMNNFTNLMFNKADIKPKRITFSNA